VHAIQMTKAEPPPTAETVRHVLVVDDSRAQRHMVSMQLRRWGYRVSESEDATAALDLCAAEPVDIVISDWMMPGMSGLEFCRKFRAMGRESYGYFVLLTSKSEKNEIADGLEAGADDFLAKPVSGSELRARLRAGERMLAMQAELLAQNRVIASTLSELQGLYDSLDRDLIEARKLQQTLIRDRDRDYGWARASLMLRNSGRVGGDLVGSFQADDRRVVAYSIDVSGHGVASAMMTARLAGFLTGGSPDQNLAFAKTDHGGHILLPPDQVAERFNRLMLEEIQAEQYFTMAFATLDRQTCRLSLVQAGHPHPMLIRRSGEVVSLGKGGLPIGLIPDAPYDCVEIELQPGDRLVLVSDGMTECPLPDGSDFGQDGLSESLARSADLGGSDLLEALVWDLMHRSGLDTFPDDISGVVLDLREDDTGQHRPVPGVAQPRNRLFDW
jgi:phosphoserine phosphatase RsbU/P